MFGLLETFLNGDLSSKMFDIRGYTFIRCDRYNGQGGGVWLYIKDGIDYIRRNDLENTDTESIWIEIKIKNSKPIIFGNIYRPPDSSQHLLKNFDIVLSKTLKNVDNENKESIIMGDLNVNYLIDNDHQEIKDIFKDNGFMQIIENPTRVTHTSATLIDIVQVNNKRNISYNSVIPAGLSDHDLILCVRKIHNITFACQK